MYYFWVTSIDDMMNWTFLGHNLNNDSKHVCYAFPLTYLSETKTKCKPNNKHYSTEIL